MLDGATLPAALAAVADGAPTRGHALVQELAYGTLRHWGALDALVAGARGASRSTRSGCAALVAVALYQLDHTRAPPFAVVDRAVDAAALVARPQAKRLVNALLRRFLRERDALNAQVRTTARSRAGRIRAGGSGACEADHPAALAAIPRRRQRAPAAHAARQPPRDHARRAAAQFARRRASRRDAGRRGRPHRRREPRPVPRAAGLRRGRVLGPGRRRAARRAAARASTTGMRVLDACAAPGGKTTHLAELADVDLTALDSDAARLHAGRARTSCGCGSRGASVASSAGDAGEPAGLVGRPAVRPHPRRRAVHGVGHRAPASRRQVAAAQDRHRGVRARSSARLLDALWPLLAPRRRAAVRDLLGLRRRKTRRRSAAFVARTRRTRCAKPSAFAPEVAARGGQLLPSGNGRRPQSGRLLLRAAPQGLRRSPPATAAAAPPCRRNRHRIAPACRLLPSRSLAFPAPPLRRRGARSRGSRVVALAARCWPRRRRHAPIRLPSSRRAAHRGRRGPAQRRVRPRVQLRRSRRRCRRASRSTSCSSSSSRAAAGTGSTRRSLQTVDAPTACRTTR